MADFFDPKPKGGRGLSGSFTLPGGKKLPRKPVIIGGFILAGFLGWRWWMKSQTSPAATGDVASTDAAFPIGGAGAAVSGGSDGGNGDSSGNFSTTPDSDAAWAARAESYLEGVGFGAESVSTAIGLYLAHQPLTDSQMIIVETALAFAGPLPGGPIAIVHSVSTQAPDTAHAGIPTTVNGVTTSPTQFAPYTGAPLVTNAGPLLTGPNDTTSIGATSPASKNATISTPTVPHGTVFGVYANEDTSRFQARVLAQYGFTPSIVKLNALNPSKVVTIEKMQYNQPHGANELRIN